MMSSGVKLVDGIVVASLVMFESSSCLSFVLFSRMHTRSVAIATVIIKMDVAFMAVLLELMNVALAFYP